MKSFLFLLILTVVVAITFLSVGVKGFSREKFINEKILDMTRPLDDSIDIEFLGKLDPAYEQQ